MVILTKIYIKNLFDSYFKISVFFSGEKYQVKILQGQETITV